MALYTEFGAIDASGAAQLASYAIEKAIRKQWTNVAGRSTPVMAMLAGRINKGIKVNGKAMICSVIASEDDVTFEGVADDDQFDAMTDILTTGDTQAKYNFAHYRGKFDLTATEIELLSGPEGTARGNILESKQKKVTSKVAKLISTNTSGAGVGARTAHTGLLNLVSASNVTVGGIAQGDLSTWIPVRSSGGVFALDRVDDLVDQVERGSAEEKVDLLICTYGSGGPNILNSFRQLVAAGNQEVVVSATGEMARFGFRAFRYAGMDVVGDSFMATGAAAGKVIGVASKALFAASTGSMTKGGIPSPKMHPMTRLPRTDAFEQVFSLWFALGTNNPANHFHLGGLVS